MLNVRSGIMMRGLGFVDPIPFYEELQKNEPNQIQQWLATISPFADRAEAELRQWADVLEKQTSRGIARPAAIQKYNVEANKLYALQQNVWMLCKGNGWPDAPEPAHPPFCGSSLTSRIKTVMIGPVPVQVKMYHPVVPQDAFATGARMIYERPWWQDTVDKYDAYVASKKAARLSGFWILAAPYVGKALLWLAVGLAVQWTVQTVANMATRGSELQNQFTAMDFENQAKRYDAYTECMAMQAKTIAWSNHCLGVSNIFKAGKAPTGWITDLVGVFKWVAIAGIAGTIGYVAIKKARS